MRQAEVPVGKLPPDLLGWIIIRWEPAFGAGEIEIGYYDRVQRRVLRVALREPAPAPARRPSCRSLQRANRAALT